MAVTKIVRCALAALVLGLAAGCSAGSSTPRWINGVALPGIGDLKPWERATGEHPAVIEIYSRFGAPFPARQARQALLAHASPLIQLNPRNISLAAIAHGAYDSQLRQYNRQILSLHGPVFLSFGHEMNGTWYSWGCRRTSPPLFLAAWRHVHDLITGGKVTWVWTITTVSSGYPCPLRAWYPGNAYVGWIGINGYLRQPGETFTAAFGQTIAQLRQFARRKPVLVTEAGVALGPGWEQRIDSLYSGARRANFRGIIYFDGPGQNVDYRPQDQPAALRIFRRELGG